MWETSSWKEIICILVRDDTLVLNEQSKKVLSWKCERGRLFPCAAHLCDFTIFLFLTLNLKRPWHASILSNHHPNPEFVPLALPPSPLTHRWAQVSEHQTFVSGLLQTACSCRICSVYSPCSVCLGLTWNSVLELLTYIVAQCLRYWFNYSRPKNADFHIN